MSIVSSTRRSRALVVLLLMPMLCLLGTGNGEGRSRRTRISSLRVTTAPGGASVDAERRLGREMAARVAGVFGVVEDTVLTRYVNLVARSLAPYGARPELPWVVGVLDTDAVNAFALPGGYLYVTRGALAHLMSEAALAGVLAHEMIHVTEGHMLRLLDLESDGGSPLAGLGRLIGGATDAARMAFQTSVDEGLRILYEKGYARKDEIEADRLGVALAAVAGYDPEAFAGFLGELGALNETEGATNAVHPPPADRSTWVRAAIVENGLESIGTAIRSERYQHETRNRL